MQSRPLGIGLDLEARRKDGTTLPVEIALSVIETPEGTIAVAFGNDVTERRRIELVAQTHAQQIQALAAGLMTAQEEERRRVSRELHDQICQQLGSLAMEIGEFTKQPLPQETRSRLRAFQGRVVATAEESRHIAYRLHPSILDDLGVVASLQSLCSAFSSEIKIAVELSTIDLPRSVPRELASCLYRVAQESLQNVSKHASARHVWFALTSRNNTLTLSIADDGVGFNLEAVKGRGGLGLVGMEERARLVNAKLSIGTQQGHGTRIALEVPLPPPTDEENADFTS